MCSPTTVIRVAVLEPGVDHDALAGVGADARAVGAEDARLRHRREALAHPEVEVVQRRRAQLDQHLARRRRRDPARPRSAAPRGRRPRGSGWPSPRHTTRHDCERARAARCRARPRRRRRRAAPSRTSRPSGTSASAASAASSPTCASRWRSPRCRAIRRRCCRTRARSSRRRSATTRPAASPAPGEGRLPRYTWDDRYAELRAKLDELGRRARRRVPRARRREPARRPRGRGARGRRLLRQEHAADHAALRLLGRARHARHRRRDRADAAARRSTAARAASASTPARRARSTSRARSTRRAASRTGRSRRTTIPEEFRAPLEDRVYGCDICQDVCPWNRGVEKRRAGEPARGEPVVSLVDWLTEDGDELRRALRPPLRPAQRPALPAAERARRGRQHAAARSTSTSLDGFEDDELLAPHAEWARARIEERVVLTDVDAPSPVRALDRERPRRRRRLRGRSRSRSAPATRRATSARRGSIDGRVRDRRGDPLLAQPEGPAAPPAGAARGRRARLRHRGHLRVPARLQLRERRRRCGR